MRRPASKNPFNNEPRRHLQQSSICPSNRKSAHFTCSNRDGKENYRGSVGRRDDIRVGSGRIIQSWWRRLHLCVLGDSTLRRNGNAVVHRFSSCRRWLVFHGCNRCCCRGNRRWRSVTYCPTQGTGRSHSDCCVLTTTEDLTQGYPDTVKVLFPKRDLKLKRSPLFGDPSTRISCFNIQGNYSMQCLSNIKSSGIIFT